MRIDSWWVCSGVVPVARCERNVSVADTTMSVEHGRQMNDIGGGLNPTNGCDTEVHSRWPRTKMRSLAPYVIGGAKKARVS